MTRPAGFHGVVLVATRGVIWGVMRCQAQSIQSYEPWFGELVCCSCSALEIGDTIV